MLRGADYRKSLMDDRSLYFEGRLVDDVNRLPEFKPTLDAIAATYDHFHRPEPGAVNELTLPPRDQDQLKVRLPAIHEHGDLMLHVTYQSFMSLLTAADGIEEVFPEGAQRVRDYVEECRERDIRLVQCITDSKGDRALPPGRQSDPDQYLRVVERRADGVVIRGAKLHISGAPFAHELMVMPTKRMKPGEEDYAIACGVPVNAPGVRIIATQPSRSPDADRRDLPFNWNRTMPEAFIVFDDVFVPTERIFLDGQTNEAAIFAHSLGLWERLGATSDQVNRAEQLVGLAQLIAEANGTDRVPHIREKINELVLHATMLRAAYEAAMAGSAVSPTGVFAPDELYTNAAKVVAASNWSSMVRHLHDIAGGSAATVPSMADYDHPDLQADLEKYMSGGSGISGEYRMKLFHMIRNLTADAYGGWLAVTTIQAGGGIHAQRLVMRNHYDMDRVKALVLADVPSSLAGKPA